MSKVSVDVSDGDSNPPNKVDPLKLHSTGSNRRKQSAPRSRLIRQCNQCEFSSSVNNEFRIHFKTDHETEQIFLCEHCRSFFFDDDEYQSHLQTHLPNVTISKSILPMEESTTPINFEQPSPSESETKNLAVSSSLASNVMTIDRKRPYNVSVDPARYRRIIDPDNPNAVKYACSLCGNLYKWRKSLNKHWKEKHNDEEAPPLDAPVKIRQSKVPSSNNTMRQNSNFMQHSSIVVNPAPAPIVPTNFSWTNLSPLVSPSLDNDLSSNTPLDLTMKANVRKSSPMTIDYSSERKKFHRDSQSSNEEQRDSSNQNVNETDNEEDQDDRPSSPSLTNVNGQKNFLCSICRQRFLSIETINEHFIRNHLDELENEINGKSPPRNTNVAQQNELWNLSDPVNPLKCIQCEFVGRWPTELQKHAASHSTSRPFKCLVCSLTYKWRWDLAKHWDRAHASNGKGGNLINPYKKRDRDQARTMVDLTPPRKSSSNCSSNSSSINEKKSFDDDEQSRASTVSEDEKIVSNFSINSLLPSASTTNNIFFPTLPYFPQNSLLFPSKLAFPQSSLDNGASSIHSSRSPSPVQQRLSLTKRIEKEERNFQCHWCDYRGRWRSELIQHMRCHHARDKPYHCSACQYASSWKWDVQKHVKKQHSKDSAKIIELPDKYLFQTTLKAKHGNNDDRSFPTALLSDAEILQFPREVQLKLKSMKQMRDRTFTCQQCPFSASSISELRRHLIVHSSESPYHCFNCDYKSKWKCDVKKHMKSLNHNGPVLVGRKAMAKVMQNLGLVMGQHKTSKEIKLKQNSVSNLINSTNNKVNDEMEDDEQEIDDDDDDNEDEQNLVIVDETQNNDQHRKRTFNSQQHLRCRKCDYEAEDLSDLLVHRKNHISPRNVRLSIDPDEISEENDDESNNENQFDEKTFSYELVWLENNPQIKSLTSIDKKDRIIRYQCSQCDFSMINNRQEFLQHLEQEHIEDV